MKNFLLSISIITLLVSCSNGKKETLEVKTDLVPVNTAGYANSNSSTDIGTYNLQEEMEAPVQKKASVRKKVMKRSTVQEMQEQPETVKQPENPVSNTKTASEGNNVGTKSTDEPSTGSAGTKTGKDSEESAGNSTASNEKTKKKGWSDAAKGAAIGGAAGAIGGAVINGKNRGKGAIIGAVIGAAGGYVIGRKMDKKKQANEFSMVVH